jgi:CitMHS family citrate-Mg2+:H+ or citrate-Ca2+:H+ symporter
MSAAVGFIMIIVIVALLLKGKMSPIVVLVVVPSIAALILGNNPIAVADMIKEGVTTTTSNGILFIFSVIYFGVLSDTGLFDIIVNWLVKMAGSNVIAVTVATAIVATIAHLDGTTATTVLITIPALYPVYKRMKIDPKILLCLTGACMGVMNLLPIPALDGGRLLTQIIEMITRKRLPAKVEMIINGVGLALLLGLSAVIMVKDIVMLIFR